VKALLSRRRRGRFALLLLAMAALLAVTTPALAQIEFAPPQGKGRVVVVMSGHSGPSHYQAVAGLIAQLGYDVVLFDANSIAGNVGEGLRMAIGQALQMPHAVPGKVALIGFSEGGGQVLIHGSQMPNLATDVIAWYPATRSIGDVTAFVQRLAVPVLMLAGEADTYHGCCLIGTARALAAAAPGRIELVSYPGVEHDFVYGGSHYEPNAHTDALRRTAAALNQYLGH
jgi:dienelactone hydrolase